MTKAMIQVIISYYVMVVLIKSGVTVNSKGDVGLGLS